MKKSLPIALLIQCGCLALGIGVGSWLLVAGLLPRVGLGQVERIRQLGIHIQSIAADTSSVPLTVLLGDSITREGVDAECVAAQWSKRAGPEARFENWAISGCSLAEQQIQLPLVLKAKPEVVVFALGPASLCHLPDLPLDKAYAYAYAGFTTEQDNVRYQSLGISVEAIAALRSNRWQQQLHFRSAPKSWLNDRLRGALKGGARQVSTNWTAPYLMNGSVGESQLQWHIDLIKSWWTPERSQDMEPAQQILTELAETTRAAGATPVFVLAPVHPQLADTAAPLWNKAVPIVQHIAMTCQANVLDARETLDAEQFADALHPNQDGRQRYSRYLASGLQIPIMTARK